MAHLIAFIIIGAVKIVKWMLFKTRLIIAAFPIAVVLIFFKDLYEANTQLANGIGIALIASRGGKLDCDAGAGTSPPESTIRIWCSIGHMSDLDSPSC